MFYHGCDQTAKMLDLSHLARERYLDRESAFSQWPLARMQEYRFISQWLNITSDDRVIDYASSGGCIHHFLPECAQVSHLANWSSEVPGSLQTPLYPTEFCTDDTIPRTDNWSHWLISISGVNGILNKQGIFNEFARVLKPGGQLLLADVSQGSGVGQFLTDWVGRHSSTGFTGSFLNNRSLIELSNSGLTLLRLQEKRFHWVFGNKSAAAKYCKLLFGIDLATEEQILAALEAYLGFEAHDEGVGLKWQLQFIQCLKPYS